MLPSRATIIRANPLLASYQTLLVVGFIVVGSFLVFSVVTIIAAIVAGPTSAASPMRSFVPLALFMFLLYSFSSISTIFQWRYWTRIEKRRFAAVAGDLSLLATEQPVANATALRLPYTLKLRPSNSTILLFIGMSVVFAFVLAALLIWPANASPFTSLGGFHLFLVFFIVIAAVIIITMLAIFLSPLGTQKIQVTEQGVRVRYGAQKSFVRWEEARLFAVYNTWGVPRKGWSLTYELSSATAIARWNWIRHPNFFSISAAGVPPGEYQQQMYALNELIVARTGLPLFDLRKEPERPV